MELQTIINEVFTLDKSSPKISVKHKNNKEQCLIEIRERVDTYLKETFPENSGGGSYSEDRRVGRVGNPNVYFSLDRSFGIVAINQEGLNVISACRFATIAATCGVFSGRWMYEVQLGSKGIMQIGWCSNRCSFSADRGCGDTTHSYAYDGSRNKSWNVISQPYGEHWKSGDIIGICVDLDHGNIEFHRNGRGLGLAFEGICAGSGFIYIPCISLVDGESVSANFGARPFYYPVRGFEALQCAPHAKMQEADMVLKWLANITELVTPAQTTVLRCENASDVNDTKFWNRLFYIVMFHVNDTVTNKYCLFSHFLPFLCELAGLGTASSHGLHRVHKVLDEIWLYTKEPVMDKMLYSLLSHLSNSFKQMSDSLDSPAKLKTLDVMWVLLSHEKTRKFVISHFLFDRIHLLPLLHHKPLDDYNMQAVIRDTWWDTKGLDAQLEGNRAGYDGALHAIERSSQALEARQLALLHLVFTNRDGTDSEPSSRRLFLYKFNKFCWHEWECTQNDINTRMPSSVVYSGFLRLVHVLFELWKSEVPKEMLMCPSRHFYDQSIKYKRCDRIGGIEQYLYSTFHDEVAQEIGEFSPAAATTDDIAPINIQLTTLAGGIQEIIRIVDGDLENNNEANVMPSTSSAPFLHALFAPLARETPEDIGFGNIECRKSLISFLDNLIMLYSAIVAKHCKKISKAFSTFNQLCTEYHDLLVTHRTLDALREHDDPTLHNIRMSLELLKGELDKRSRRVGWIRSVLLNADTHARLLSFFGAVHLTVRDAERRGDLFSFLPDFHLHTFGCLVQAFAKDFAAVRTVNDLKGGSKLIRNVSDLCVRMLSDPRIKHIDCKKVPVNALAALATSAATMRVLESLERERCEQLVHKLFQPYGDRHWKGTNWILIRFWHGDGYGFRYTEFPHHNVNVPNHFPVNYIMYNIAPNPSELYQDLVRRALLDGAASVPKLLDSLVAELHYIFGEFLTQMQELQRALERNEQLLMFGRLYKMCASYFNKSIALIRVLDMFVSLAPRLFTESYYPESLSLTKRIVQVVLLIVHRITTRQGCFRTVMNSRIAVLENIDYLPIETACVAVLLALLHKDLENFNRNNIIVPFMSKIVLNDSSYNFENLQILIGLPDTTNATIMSLHDYTRNLSASELALSRKLLELLSYYEPMLSAINVIPEDDMCIICCSAPIDVKFRPCNHTSCLSCITYYLAKNKKCFFCKREIMQVVRISTGETVDELTASESDAGTT